jgi:hypothetical protein
MACLFFIAIVASLPSFLARALTSQDFLTTRTMTTGSGATADEAREVQEIRREAMAIALGGLGRLGGQSPASEMARDTHLLRFFVTAFVLRHELVTKVVAATAAGNMSALMNVLKEIGTRAFNDEALGARLVRCGMVEAIVAAIMATVRASEGGSTDTSWYRTEALAYACNALGNLATTEQHRL